MHMVNILGRRAERRGFSNPHFWIIVFITIAITCLYYFITILDFRPFWVRDLEIFEFQVKFHGILLYIPIIYTTIIYWWRGALILWVISVIIGAPLAFYYQPFILNLILSIFYLCIPVLVASIIALELSWRAKERKGLIEREKERQIYVSQIFKAQEEERKRISQEIHDDSIHSLLLIAKKVHNMVSNEGLQLGNQSKEEAKTVREDILRVSDDLRRLTLDLRPGILDNVGFIPALRWLIDRLNEEGRTKIKMIVKGEEIKIPHGPDVTLFRIVQETLNNIEQHSKATEAMVLLEFGMNNLKIVIHDNGKGFILPKRIDSLASKGKLGLIGIQERTRSINGSLSIESTPGTGTSIAVECKL